MVLWILTCVCGLTVWQVLGAQLDGGPRGDELQAGIAVGDAHGQPGRIDRNGSDLDDMAALDDSAERRDERTRRCKLVLVRTRRTEDEQEQPQEKKFAPQAAGTQDVIHAGQHQPLAQLQARGTPAACPIESALQAKKN